VTETITQGATETITQGVRARCALEGQHVLPRRLGLDAVGGADEAPAVGAEGAEHDPVAELLFYPDVIHALGPHGVQYVKADLRHVGELKGALSPIASRFNRFVPSPDAWSRTRVILDTPRGLEPSRPKA
jgi:hypothetical protein